MSVSCEKNFSIQMASLDWNIAPVFGMSAGCSGSITTTSETTHLETQVNSNTNDKQLDFPCNITMNPPHTCAFPGAGLAAQSGILGPYDEARNVTVTGTCDLTAVAYQIWADSGGGCMPSAGTDASAVGVSIWNEDFTVQHAFQNITCTPGQSPKVDQAINVNFLLPMGQQARILVNLSAIGLAAVVSIDVNVTATPP